MRSPRERSNIIWRLEGGGGLLKPSECRVTWEGVGQIVI